MTWQTRAACAGDPTPSDWDDEAYSDAAGAIEVCSECPVKADCLAFALEADAYGIWGTGARSYRRCLVCAEQKRRAS